MKEKIKDKLKLIGCGVLGGALLFFMIMVFVYSNAIMLDDISTHGGLKPIFEKIWNGK